MGGLAGLKSCIACYVIFFLQSSRLFLQFEVCCIERLASSKPKITSSTNQTNIKIRHPPLGKTKGCEAPTKNLAVTNNP